MFHSVALTWWTGKSLNEELVNAGYAWVYPQYCKIQVCKKWYQYEAEARSMKIGM